MAHAAETISARRLCTPEQWVRSAAPHIERISTTREALHHRLLQNTVYPRGFISTSSSATGEPPSDESFDARYRDFARTPILVRFQARQLPTIRSLACCRMRASSKQLSA